MKKTFTILFLFATFLVSAQKLSKKQAKRLIGQAIENLKDGDSTAFASLWLFNQEPWPYHKRYFSKEDVNEHFKELRNFLDTALMNNLKSDGISVESICNCDDKAPKKSCRYNISTVFRYKKGYYKGFALNVEFVGERWACRFEPDYTTITVNPGKT